MIGANALHWLCICVRVHVCVLGLINSRTVCQSCTVVTVLILGCVCVQVSTERDARSASLLHLCWQDDGTEKVIVRMCNIHCTWRPLFIYTHVTTQFNIRTISQSCCKVCVLTLCCVSVQMYIQSVQFNVLQFNIRTVWQSCSEVNVLHLTSCCKMLYCFK